MGEDREFCQIQAVTKAEELYCYGHPWGIGGYFGYVGYLSGSVEKGMTDSASFEWNNGRESQVDEEAFQADLNVVIGSLTNQNEGGSFLRSKEAMRAFCASSSVVTEVEKGTFCTKVRTEQYVYMLRMMPRREEGRNFLCYAYRRDWFEHFLSRAAKGIRFVDLRYEEKFRLPDGERVKVYFKDGDNVTRQCRYIDDYHMFFGENVFHICEFAERFENIVTRIIPWRSDLPDRCFTVDEESRACCLVCKGDEGVNIYELCSGLNREQLYERAERKNMEYGIGEIGRDQMAAMFAGACYGWGSDKADPTQYDRDGRPKKAIRQKQL